MSNTKDVPLLGRIHLGLQEAFEKAKKETAIDGELVLLKDDRFDDALAFLKEHYIPDEPCSRAIGQEITTDLKEIWFLLPFRNGLTVMLLRPGSKEIIGMFLVRVEGKNDKLVVDDINDQALKRANHLNNQLAEAADIFQTFGIDEIVKFEHISVHKDYRNQGIATSLIDFCINMYEDLNISPMYAAVHCSSNYARKAFENKGFKKICSINYDDYYFNGELVYPNMSEHTAFTYLMKKLA